ncbi:MAG: hypothetical protein ACTS46_01775, partial [Candidatus Hodgkinia cicadicola]
MLSWAAPGVGTIWEAKLANFGGKLMLKLEVVTPLGAWWPERSIKSRIGKANVLSKTIINALRFTELRRTPQTSQRPV